MKKVEQINNDGEIVIDEDKTFKIGELVKRVSDVLDYKLQKENGKIMYNNICLLLKNITYLGYPHPIYKKRIQLPFHFFDKIVTNDSNNIQSIIVGVYSYTDELVFAVYNVDSYINNKFNNSSAHILTSDIYNVRINGYFRKIDVRGNEILLFNELTFKEYIESINNNTSLTFLDQERLLMQYIEDFWDKIPNELLGVKCYEEMVKSEYSKAYEAEWIGFYNEFMFEKHLISQPTELIQIHGDKKENGIDLDLKINISDNFYADLKAHNIDSGVQGNKKETVEELIAVNGRLWYILTGFTPVFDKEKGYKVTDYWRNIKLEFNSKCTQKSKLKSTSKRSYGEKMKHSIEVKELYILEITADKIKFISQYDQGKNSDGKERKPKIRISKKNIEMLSIFKKKRK